MSEASIIQQLTLNQPTTFTTSPSIDRVKIHNDSSFYLRVYFGLGAPGRFDSGGWHDTIGPGASPVIPVVGASRRTEGLDLTNSQSIGNYAGQVVVLPFMPTGAPTPTGVVNGAALCYLTGFYPYEFAETGGQIEAFVQAAKQGRYIAVQGAMQSFSGPPIYTDETTADGTLLQGITLTPSAQPALYAANVDGQSRINMYVWTVCVLMRARTPAVARLNAWYDCALTSSVGVVKASSSNIPIMLHAVNFGMDRVFFQPARALLAGVLVAQNTLASGDVISLRYRFDSNAGHTPLGSFELAHSSSISIDILNQTPLYALGQPTSTAAANPAWNAVYNPQTY